MNLALNIIISTTPSGKYVLWATTNVLFLTIVTAVVSRQK